MMADVQDVPPESGEVVVVHATAGDKLEPQRGAPLKSRIQRRLPARLRRRRPAPAGIVFDPFSNATEGPKAPPYTCFEVTKTVLMTPVAIVRILLFLREGGHCSASEAA